MIEILPSQKIKIDPLADRERFLVFEKDETGSLHITGFERYLERTRKEQRLMVDEQPRPFP
jgi:hypothetical protein